MLRTGWRAGALRGAALGLCLITGCHQATAGDSAGGCAPPKPWHEQYARRGRPQAEFAACVREQAYATRKLSIPIDSTAYGLVASCQVQIDRFEGAIVLESQTQSAQERQAADREAVGLATAAVTQYRRCADHR